VDPVWIKQALKFTEKHSQAVTSCPESIKFWNTWASGMHQFRLWCSATSKWLIWKCTMAALICTNG
jgi:hypothetical protein